MPSKMRIDSPMVVALGGNAISRPDEEGNVEQQFRNTRQTSVHLADLIQAGAHLVVTHGNGPQVGNVLRRVELAARELYRLPLDICGAHTQGGMGFMIAQCLGNELRRRGINRNVTAIVTAVEVDPQDPGFANPTKPIGSYYRKQKAENLMSQHGWRMTRVKGRGYRRVVPSPAPKAIVEIDLIRRLASEGELLVAAGGGGVPVIRTREGDYVGVEAVIDKDRTSGLLARQINAATLVIATNVERVALDYGKPTQRFLDRLTVAEAQMHLVGGHFPPGSMGPKIEAAIDFLEGTSRDDAVVIICELERIAEALSGQSGTWIVKRN
mgnify:CR=1 FL=1